MGKLDGSVHIDNLLILYKKAWIYRWYEADINYTGGFRTHDRILYSNDGLIFVTYEHYQTFYEITN